MDQLLLEPRIMSNNTEIIKAFEPTMLHVLDSFRSNFSYLPRYTYIPI